MNTRTIIAYLVGGYYMQRGSRASQQTGHIVQHYIRLRLIGKQLHVSVEKVSLSDMNALLQDLVN